jgi:hypothetical protein
MSILPEPGWTKQRVAHRSRLMCLAPRRTLLQRLIKFGGFTIIPIHPFQQPHYYL